MATSNVNASLDDIDLASLRVGCVKISLEIGLQVGSSAFCSAHFYYAASIYR